MDDGQSPAKDSLGQISRSLGIPTMTGYQLTRDIQPLTGSGPDDA